MTTWHQDRAGVNPWSIHENGWVLLTDRPNTLMSAVAFGENQAEAEDWFEKRKQQQSESIHYLFYNGRLVAGYRPGD